MAGNVRGIDGKITYTAPGIDEEGNGVVEAGVVPKSVYFDAPIAKADYTRVSFQLEN